MNLPFTLVKQTLGFLASSKRKAFIEACKDPEKTQAELKDKILRNSKMPFPEGPTDYLSYPHQAGHIDNKVLFYETTSGSTGNKKKIPYTKSLLKSFENMFLLWAHDVIFNSGLDFKTGKFFMSVSPQIGTDSQDDRKYLSPSLSLLLTPFLASNPNDHKGETSEEFFLKISRDLIKNRNLEVFSVWSPTYLLSLLSFMREHQKELNLPTSNWEELWPKLKLISCWTHAQAKASAAHLKREFPNVKFQPKGLLLTEAPVTIPWSEANGNIPLLTETYLEFLEGDRILKLHELEVDKSYVVLTSQMNGFLRYNTQDEVRVTGFYYKTPVLEFMGRIGQYSDLAGEKLSENALRTLFADRTSPFLIVPDDSAILPYYRIFTEDNSTDWETRLREIHHYELARDLNQLSQAKVIPVKNLSKLYLDFFQSERMVLGDIKEKILLNNPIQARKFLAWIAREYPSSHLY